MTDSPRAIKHIALQFGKIKHFNEGLGEFSRQLGQAIATHAPAMKAERGWQFHFHLPSPWHGLFGDAVNYLPVSDCQRWPHRSPVDIAVWHALHQHMRYRPPMNSGHNIITVHDLNHVYAKAGLSKWWQDLRTTRHLRQADRLVAISAHTRDSLVRHMPWTKPAPVIHNGVADLSTAPQASLPGLAGPFFLHVSRMSPSKNVEALLGMAGIWPEKQFVLAGPASAEVQRHQAHCQQHGLRNVVFHTDVSESQKAWLYAHCEAFLFPSLAEGFGLPPIEAMHFGKPVIVAKRTSLPEVCGDAAMYWTDFEPHAMRAALETLLQAVAAGRWPASTVRKHASQYSWHHAARQYMDLYREAIGPC